MHGLGQTSRRAEWDIFWGGVIAEGFVVVTTKSLRHFAVDCLAWALKEDEPSRKQMIVTAARSWAATADEIDRRVEQDARKSFRI